MGEAILSIQQGRALALEYSDKATDTAEAAIVAAQIILTLGDITVDDFNIDSPIAESQDLINKMNDLIAEYSTDADAVRVRLEAIDAQFNAQLTALLAVNVPDLEPRVNAALAKFESFEPTMESYIQGIVDAAAAGLPGLTPGWEEQIWNRDRDREVRELNRESESAISLFAARGFPMPPGALFDATRQLEQGRRDKIISISRDTAIKKIDSDIEIAKIQAQLALDGYSAAATTYVSYMNAYINGRINLEQLLFESAKLIIDLRRTVIQALAEYVTAAVRSATFLLESNARVIELQAKVFDILTGYYQTYITAQKINADVKITNSQTLLAQQKIIGDLATTSANIRTGTTLGAANVYKDVASAAISAAQGVAVTEEDGEA